MCNLNIFIKTHKKNSNRLKNLICLLNNTTYNSFIGNNDGDGVYFDSNDSLIKSKKKINFINYSKEIQQSNFILSHQRLATHGLSHRYTQPFKSEEFVLLHNGILSDFAKKDYSDSYGFFKEFKKEFGKATEKTREEKIKNVIKKLLDLTTGSYSICLFDKIENAIYYFKNQYTNILFFRTKDKKEVYITTNIKNEDFLNLYSNFEKMTFFDYKIYKISIKNKNILYSIIGEIEKPTEITYNNWNNYGIPFSKPTKQEKLKGFSGATEYNILTGLGFEERNKIKKCCCCGVETYLYNRIENKYFCEECITETYI